MVAQAIVVAPKFHAKAVEIGSCPSTFECTMTRISSGQSSCLVAVTFRPDSSAVTGTFFSELADVIKHLLTFIDPLVLAGDENIRLGRESDPNPVAYGEPMSAFGMVQLIQGATHDQGEHLTLSSLVMNFLYRPSAYMTMVSWTTSCCAGGHVLSIQRQSSLLQLVEHGDTLTRKLFSEKTFKCQYFVTSCFGIT